MSATAPSQKAGRNVPHIEPNRFRIGIVGSGPAGMACAADMAKAGCDVTVYEAFHLPGGVLRYGIPDFRLPNTWSTPKSSNLRNLGVHFECNTLVGRLFTIEQMLDELGYHAVFIGTGAGYPAMLGIPGDSLNGVLSANELLTRCNLMRARDFPAVDTPLPLGRHVAVVGAGNTAMDAMRVCLRLGAEKVSCIYRRSRAECPARAEEVHHAEEEGIAFHWLTAPVEVLGDGRGNVRALRCQSMVLGEPDRSGRARPVPVPGSEHDIRGRSDRLRHRHQRQPDHRPNLEPRIEQARLYRGGREPRHLARRRLRRRRHRHRGRDRHRGDGRGAPARRAA